MKRNTNQSGWLGFSAIAIAIGMLFSTAANAATALYHLGESDAGSLTNGSPGDATTVDSSGNGFDLTKIGSPTYSSNAAPVAGSTLSMAFVSADPDAYSRPASVTSDITNVRIDAWAYPTTITAGGYIALNGSGATGYGIYQAGNTWSFIEEFVSFNYAVGPLGTVVPNHWVHLTLLLDSTGTLTGYINGTLVVTQTIHAHAPSGGFAIGSAFDGNIDEVEVFTPEPASLGLLVVGAGAMLLRRRRS